MKIDVLLVGYRGYLGGAVKKFLSKDSHVRLTCRSISKPNEWTDVSDPKFLSQFKCIVYTTGCSGIHSAKRDPIDCIDHVLKFVEVVEALDPDYHRLIYVASASVYGNTHGQIVDETTSLTRGSHMYDMSKQIVDKLVQSYKGEWFGLRLGTVNGSYMNLPARTDLLINRMWACADHIDIHMPTTLQRAVLDIHDFVRAVYRLVTLNPNQCHTPKSGIYNLCSFNATVDNIAQRVSRIMHKPINYINDEKSEAPSPYDFGMSTSKFQQTFEFAFTGTIGNIVHSLQILKEWEFTCPVCRSEDMEMVTSCWPYVYVCSDCTHMYCPYNTQFQPLVECDAIDADLVARVLRFIIKHSKKSISIVHHQQSSQTQLEQLVSQKCCIGDSMHTSQVVWLFDFLSCLKSGEALHDYMSALNISDDALVVVSWSYMNTFYMGDPDIGCRQPMFFTPGSMKELLDMYGFRVGYMRYYPDAYDGTMIVIGSRSNLGMIPKPVAAVDMSFFKLVSTRVRRDLETFLDSHRLDASTTIVYYTVDNPTYHEYLGYLCDPYSSSVVNKNKKLTVIFKSEEDVQDMMNTCVVDDDTVYVILRPELRIVAKNKFVPTQI